MCRRGVPNRLRTLDIGAEKNVTVRGSEEDSNRRRLARVKMVLEKSGPDLF